MSKELQLALSFVISFILSRAIYKLGHLSFVAQFGAFWGVLVRLALWGTLFALSYFLFRHFSRQKDHNQAGAAPSSQD
ncbi:MAG: hypothetical protein Q8O00_15280 [Holophaga sp.]|nr:hypothetical protein [Holophaga sp.]